MRSKQENCAISCKILIDKLIRSKDDDERQLLLDDLLWKVQYLQEDLRWYFSTQALKCFVQDDIAKRLEHKEPEMKTRAVDVAILTVKQPELLAAKVAFDINLTALEDEIENGLRFWENVIQTRYGTTLDIAVTMSGMPGNVSCAVACDRLFNTYDVGLCVLVGMAAGLRDKVSLGDVVLADIILDYEYARLEANGSKNRPRSFSPRVGLSRDIEYFNPKLYGWHEDFFRNFELLKAILDVPMPIFENGWKPNFVSGVLLSGEKLIADGRMLDEKRKELDDRIVAAEMEAFGFARSCEENEVPWLVFRGISDYGNPGKDDLWQITSALSAATAVRVFLKNVYRKPHKIR